MTSIALVLDVEQRARELAQEVTSEEEFLAAFGHGSVCERCGRTGLDDDEYTDCELVADPADPEGPWLLLCHDCVKQVPPRGLPV